MVLSVFAAVLKTKRTITCDNATITMPTIAYMRAVFALAILELSPPDVVYFIPETIIITTARNPATKPKRRTTVFRTESICVPPPAVVSLQSLPLPIESHTACWLGVQAALA